MIGSVLSGRLGWTLISFFALLALWTIVAAILQSRLFPGPLAVGDKLISEAASGELVPCSSVARSAAAPKQLCSE